MTLASHHPQGADQFLDFLGGFGALWLWLGLDEAQLRPAEGQSHGNPVPSGPASAGAGREKWEPQSRLAVPADNTRHITPP